MLSTITIENPYKTTEISGKNRWKEEKSRQKRLPCKLKKGLYEILLVGTCSIALSNGKNQKGL